MVPKNSKIKGTSKVRLRTKDLSYWGSVSETCRTLITENLESVCGRQMFFYRLQTGLSKLLFEFYTLACVAKLQRPPTD
ncbi:MAG: hypothetical protein HC846_03850 [Blastocatellia bacterium]|nr:hypothetical protein [Blastocatellia bacterium]